MPVKTSVAKGFRVVNESLPIVAILSLFGFFWNSINIYLTPKIQDPTVQISAFIIVFSLVFVFLSLFLQGGVLGYVRDKIKLGKAGLKVFIDVATRCYFRLLLVGLIITITTIIFVALAMLMVSLLKNAGIVLAIVLGLAAIYVLILLFFAPYAVIVHDEKPIAALKKSISLVKANLFKVLGISGILLLVGFVAGLLIGVAIGLFNVAIPGLAAQLITALLSSIMNAYLGLFVTASLMNFYLEISNK